MLSEKFGLNMEVEDAVQWIGCRESEDVVYSSSHWPGGRSRSYRPFAFEETESSPVKNRPT